MNKNNIDFDYLRPPGSLVKKILLDDYYKKHGEGKKAMRKIFYNTEYDDFERKCIREFEALIKKELSHLTFPSWWTEADTLRFAYSKKFDIKKSVKGLRIYLEWLSDPSIWQLNHASQKFLEDGVFYQYGRDKQLRPIIIINVYKVNLKVSLEIFLKALNYLLLTVERYMFYPGKIENWIIIIDVGNMGLLNLPFKVLKKIIDVTSDHFTCRLEKIYILNPSFSLNTSWNVISGMMDQETVDKITFVKKSNFNELQQYIDEAQLEQKYGGLLPNLEQFWPPKNTFNEFGNSQSIQMDNKTKAKEDIIQTSSLAARTVNYEVKGMDVRDTKKEVKSGYVYEVDQKQQQEKEKQGKEQKEQKEREVNQQYYQLQQQHMVLLGSVMNVQNNKMKVEGKTTGIEIIEGNNLKDKENNIKMSEYTSGIDSTSNNNGNNSSSFSNMQDIQSNKRIDMNKLNEKLSVSELKPCFKDDMLRSSLASGVNNSRPQGILTNRPNLNTNSHEAVGKMHCQSKAAPSTPKNNRFNEVDKENENGKGVVVMELGLEKEICYMNSTITMRDNPKSTNTSNNNSNNTYANNFTAATSNNTSNTTKHQQIISHSYDDNIVYEGENSTIKMTRFCGFTGCQPKTNQINHHKQYEVYGHHDKNTQNNQDKVGMKAEPSNSYENNKSCNIF